MQKAEELEGRLVQSSRLEMKRREWARLKSSRGMEDPGMGRPNPNNWVPERGLSPLYTALPFRDCLRSAFSRKCFSETHSMCEEGGSPVRKFCPTHLPLASHNLEELLFPASLHSPRTGGL